MTPPVFTPASPFPPPSSRRPAPRGEPQGDRRVQRRARLSAPTVTVTVSGKLVDAIGSDLSAGGMRLVSARPAAIGDAVSLAFFLDGDLVSARGTIRWCARTPHDLFAFGVGFTAVEDDGAGLVDRYCAGTVS